MIEKRYYNAATLSDAVAVYEREYEMSSADFFSAHQADSDAVKSIPRFQRSVWAGLWQELHEFGDSERDRDSLATHVRHSFQMA